MPDDADKLGREIAAAMCGDDHLACTYPDCGCKVVPARLPAVMALVRSYADARVRASQALDAETIRLLAAAVDMCLASNAVGYSISGEAVEAGRRALAMLRSRPAKQ